jgi:catechol 2,3-dioxygenase-like lactoylglutathione lyase family enzyme
MSTKVHLHLHVSDLGKSRDFYERFLGSGPVKVKTGYVKFLPEWAPVNLALSEGAPAAEGAVNHVGVQVDTVSAVMDHLARVKAAGLPVREEMGVNCCHANQDKFWVQDPDGVQWEVYHLNHDLEDDAPAAKPLTLQLAKGGACCGPSSCAS